MARNNLGTFLLMHRYDQCKLVATMTHCDSVMIHHTVTAICIHDTFHKHILLFTHQGVVTDTFIDSPV